ncbi:MAG: thermonuclease family protein [Halieaceae bacterium]|nr:thermonuclease family protein [Halieaceae bacterium]
MLTFQNTFLCSAILIAGLCLATPALGYEISSYAGVNDDGTLRIKGKTIRLFGIHIPETTETCSQNRIPRICGSRASVALEFKIDGFVSCALLERHKDSTYTGQCRVNVSAFDEGDDLSAYLLQKGWAVALPDAPFEYHTLEKIARSRSFGVWGIPVDNVIHRRR